MFIDGTFNDMHAERDFLVKDVFPELSEWCEKRRILLYEVDLRWGITEEESVNCSTISTSLRYIDKCRPFYICFLGQRRGWVPDLEYDVNMRTREMYPEIDDLQDMSVTEMGIEHALLRPLRRVLDEYKSISCPPARHSLFFFRDPGYVDEISPAQRLIYTNENEVDIEHADEKLAEIKQRILDKKYIETEENANRKDDEKVYVDVTEYSGTWDRELQLPELSHYVNGEGNGRLTDFKCGDKPLKEVLLEQLKEHLAAEFPEHMHILAESGLQKDLDEQDIFCHINSEGFIPRPEYTEKLRSYVEGSSRDICLLSAEEGYGKTMLLANFATDFEERYENKRFYKRFCGASDLSSQVYSLWKTIIDEAGISEDESFYPNALEELKRNIPEILQAIADKGESVIIIDAINQIPDGMDMLNWIGTLPQNLKLIISITEDRENEKFKASLEKIKAGNNICGFEMKELDDDAKHHLIREYLSRYLKAFDDVEIDTICDFRASENPLFLKILLEEMRVFGSFDQLKDKIMMFGDSPKTAFNHVLQRLEEDEKCSGRTDIVPLLFSRLAYSKEGLSEQELADIIESQTGLDRTYIQNAIRLNLRQVKPYMARKDGRYDFFYESFRAAAQERYVS